jgi:hypothetical protein
VPGKNNLICPAAAPVTHPVLPVNQAPQTVRSHVFCAPAGGEISCAAVLGWGRPVVDEQAGHASRMFYQELSRGKSILDAVQVPFFHILTFFLKYRLKIVEFLYFLIYIYCGNDIQMLFLFKDMVI